MTKAQVIQGTNDLGLDLTFTYTNNVLYCYMGSKLITSNFNEDYINILKQSLPDLRGNVYVKLLLKTYSKFLIAN